MDLVKFDELSGVRVYYARTNQAYENTALCQKTRTRKINPRFLIALDAAIGEVDTFFASRLGRLNAVVSGGAYVNKPGEHGRGCAFDLGGLHWQGGRILTCLEVADFSGIPREHAQGQYLVYLAVESILRNWFGTVLGVHWDGRHRNHWHVDQSSPVRYLSASPSRLRFLQETVCTVWGEPCGTPDGVIGPKTNEALMGVRSRLGLGPLSNTENWFHYLALTAIEARRYI